MKVPPLQNGPDGSKEKERNKISKDNNLGDSVVGIRGVNQAHETLHQQAHQEKVYKKDNKIQQNAAVRPTEKSLWRQPLVLLLVFVVLVLIIFLAHREERPSIAYQLEPESVPITNRKIIGEFARRMVNHVRRFEMSSAR